MKKIYLILVLAILAVIPVSAQERGKITPEQRKEFREYKMKFIAQEMNLQDDNRKQFFEIYNQLSDERLEIREKLHDLNAKVKKGVATDADYAQINRLKEQEAEIDRRYDSKFAAFLSNKEIFKMKEAEKLFHQKLHEMHQKKGKKR